MCIKRCISAFKNKPRSYKNLKKWVSVYKRDSRVFSLLNLSILFPSGSTREEKVVLESWDMFDLHEMKLKRSPGFEVKWGANVRRFIVLILWLQSKHQASLSATGKLTNFGSSRRALNESSTHHPFGYTWFWASLCLLLKSRLQPFSSYRFVIILLQIIIDLNTYDTCYDTYEYMMRLRGTSLVHCKYVSCRFSRSLVINVRIQIIDNWANFNRQKSDEELNYFSHYDTRHIKR